MSNTNCAVARWLETFFCEKYAETFEKHGYSTLQQVCSLDIKILFEMGVRSIDCEKIMENISVLKQALQLTSTNSSTACPSIDQFDAVTHSSTLQEAVGTNVKPIKKPKSKVENNKSVNNSASTAPPNITIQLNSSNQIPQHMYKTKANPELAKQIANELLVMTKNENLNSKYKCIPLNPSQYQNQQFMIKTNLYSNNSKQKLIEEDPQKNSSNDPIKSLEKLVASPETKVVDPKSVVYDPTERLQQQYKENPLSLKRMNNDNNSNLNADIYDGNKKFCAESINNQEYNYNQQQIENNYYSQPLNYNTNSYDQQLNDYYNQNNNLYSLNLSQNYNYFQPETQSMVPSMQQHQQHQESVYNNESYLTRQDYYQYSPQQQFYLNNQ